MTSAGGRCNKRRQPRCALMRAEQHVSVPRCGQLAVLTACRARGARFAVAQDARRDDPGLATIRNPGNVGSMIVVHKEDQMKHLYLLGISLLAVSACAPQPAPPPPAVAQPVGAPSPGSPTNTTRAFDGYYGNTVARNVSPGCPNSVTGRTLSIRNGLATFQVLTTGTVDFQGYVNPQGQLTMVSQQGQTFQGQIDPNFVLTGRAAGPNCVYDATWNRIQAF
jgi:hypothetical protein